MFKLIYKIKKEEFNDTIDSLLINSNINRLFIKSIFFFLILLLSITFLGYPIQLLTLFNTINISIFTLNINLFLFFMVITILSGNKNILHVFNNDLVTFYKNKYLFIFTYIKEKIVVLSFSFILELLIIQSYTLSLTDLKSCLFSIFIVNLSIIFNIFFIKFKINSGYSINKYLLKNIKLTLILCVYSLILIFITVGYFGFDKIPNYIIINIPFFIFIANLFTYSESIFLNHQYKQLFFMYKYLKIPVYTIYKKSVLYTKTMPMYGFMCLIGSIFLFANDYSLIKIIIYIVNSFISFYILLFLFYLLVKIESFKNQKNYFFYFLILEIFFILIVINILFIG